MERINKVIKMNKYKQYLKENIFFILGEINFALFHLKWLNLDDKFKDRIIKIENEINDLLEDMNNDEIFQGDEKK